MANNLPALAREIFVWTALLITAAIALLAVGTFAIRLGTAATHVGDPLIALGLVGVLAGVGVASLILATAWRLASRGGNALWIAVAGGLLLIAVGRLAIGFLFDSRLVGERRFYDEIARGILAGNCCFGDRPPGYPVALAGAYALLGPGPSAAELLNLLLGLICGAALFALVRAVADVRAATLGLYLFAMWPAGALISNGVMPETLYSTLLILAALAVIRGAAAGSVLLGGGLLAAAQYVRPTTVALLPAYVLARWWPDGSLKRILMRFALPLGVTFLLLLAPVVIYNVQAHDEVSISTSAFGGWSLYVGTDERTGGQFSEQAQSEIDALTPGGVWDDSNAAGQVAVARLARDPLLLARLLPPKFAALWAHEDFGVMYGLAGALLQRPAGTLPSVASAAFYAVLMAAAAFLVFRHRHDLDRLSVLCLAVTLSISLFHVFIEVRDRYHAYVTPMFIGVVAIGIWQWASHRSATNLAGPSRPPA